MHKDNLVTTREWVNLIQYYADELHPISGTSKVYYNQHFRLSPLDDSLSLDLMGYRDAKIKQLHRNYYNPGSNEKAITDYYKKVSKGNLGSVGVSCHGKEKKGTEQGFCLLGYTLVNKGENTSLSICYRTTELVKKFYADLCFFQSFFIPQFKEALAKSPIDEVNIYCSSLSMNFLYLPLAIPHMDNWRSFILGMDTVTKKKAIYLLDYVINKDTSHGGISNLQRSCHELYSEELMKRIKKFIERNKDD